MVRGHIKALDGALKEDKVMKTWAAISFITGTVLVVASVVVANVQGFDLMDEIHNLISVESVQVEKEIDVTVAKRIVVRADNEEVKIVGVSQAVDTGWDDVVVRKSPDVIRVNYSQPTNGRWGYDVRLEGDELIVERWSEEVFMQIFPWFVTGLKPVLIEIPMGLMVDIDVETSNASVSAKSLSAQDIKLHTSNGAVRVNDVEANLLDLRSSNGAIELKAVVAKGIVAKTNNGVIRLDRVKADSIEGKSSNGAIIGLIGGLRDEFSIKVNTSNGKVVINGKEKGKSYDEGDGTKMIKLETSNGWIRLDFSDDEIKDEE